MGQSRRPTCQRSGFWQAPSITFRADALACLQASYRNEPGRGENYPHQFISGTGYGQRPCGGGRGAPHEYCRDGEEGFGAHLVLPIFRGTRSKRIGSATRNCVELGEAERVSKRATERVWYDEPARNPDTVELGS